jgi:hypothetical protein
VPTGSGVVSTDRFARYLERLSSTVLLGGDAADRASAVILKARAGAVILKGPSESEGTERIAIPAAIQKPWLESDPFGASRLRMTATSQRLRMTATS